MTIILHNLTNDKKMHHEHAVAHVQQLNLIFFEVIMNHIAKVLKEKDMMQSMQTITTKLFLCFFDIKEKRKKEKESKKKQKIVYLQQL